MGESRAAITIGLFDSGWGGLSIAAAVRDASPSVDLLYIGDHAWCPYGELDPETIIARSLSLTRWLRDHGTEIVVIACNTASALALGVVREAFPDVPVVGVVPAVKPAAEGSRSGRIAVLATPATAASDYLANLVREHASGADVRIVPAPGLVELVEAGRTGGPDAEAAIRAALGDALDGGVDRVVLGCTHYPFLRGAIAAVAGPGVALIDSGSAIGRRVAALAGEIGRNDGADRGGAIRMFTTGDPREVAGVAETLAGHLFGTRVNIGGGRMLEEIERSCRSHPARGLHDVQAAELTGSLAGNR